MLLTMVKLEIIGPKKYFYQAVALLHELGTLHVENLSEKQDVIFQRMDVDDEAVETKKNLRNLAARLNGVMGTIEPDSKKLANKSDSELWKQNSDELSKTASELLDNLEEETRNLANQKSEMELELASLSRYQEVIQKIYPLAKSIVTLRDSETIAFLLEGDYKETVNTMNKEIGKITNDNHELISTPIDDHTTAAIIVFNKKYSAKVHRFLKDKATELNIPGNMKDLTIEAVIKEIEKKQHDHPKQIKSVKDKLNNLSEKWYYKIKEVADAVNNKIDEIEKIPSFGQTDFTFIIHGWLPHKKMADLKKAVSKNFGSKVLVRQVELTPEDLEEAPVVLENKPWVKPYEVLLNIFSAPKYGTVDPTFFIAIFFPFFFGFIVGDMGYGFVVFLTATIMRKKFLTPETEGSVIDATTRIFQIAGVSTMIFGAFYGEGFGTLLEHPLEAWIHSTFHRSYLFKIGPFPWPYSRNPAIEGRINELLITSVVLGYIHLTASFVMGIVNAVKEKNKKHFREKTALLIFMFAIAGIVYGKVSGIAPIYRLSFFTAVLTIGTAWYYGGMMAVVEYPIGLIANLFSYLRLMALGLAGAILASVANEFVHTIGLEVGILMGILLHAINVVVHTVSPAIHSIRLNLLEAFDKFYEEGGKEYKPFKARR